MRYLISIGFLFFFLPENVYAAADISTILSNLRGIIKPFTALVLFISFVGGMFMVFKAITMFKKFGMMMTMQSQPGEFTGPLVYLVVGALLMYLPTTTETFINSIFGSVNSIFGSSSIDYTQLGTGQSLLGYVSSGTIEQQWADFANTLVLFIQFIGFLSFVKGVFLMAKSGQHGAQPGTFSKAMTHMIGGAIAINFVGFIRILQNTILGS